MSPIELDAIFFQEGKVCVAYCPRLDLSSCGNDVDQARANLKTAVRLFLEESEKIGTLEDMLREAGYKLQPNQSWQALQILSTEVISLTT